MVKRTTDGLLLRENAGAPLFGVFMCLVTIVFAVLSFGNFKNAGHDQPVGRALTCVLFLFCAYNASIESTFSITRRSGRMQIKRRVLWVAVHREEYPLEAIDGVFERRTRFSDSLELRLRDGRKKAMTLIGSYRSLKAQAALMNDFINSIRNEPRTTNHELKQ